MSYIRLRTSLLLSRLKRRMRRTGSRKLETNSRLLRSHCHTRYRSCSYSNFLVARCFQNLCWTSRTVRKGPARSHLVVCSGAIRNRKWVPSNRKIESACLRPLPIANGLYLV